MLARVEPARAFGRRGNVAARARALRLAGLPRPGWKSLGVLGLLCSTVAWASLPRTASASTDEQVQWRALGVDPLDSRGSTGLAMAPTDAAAPIAFAPVRAVQSAAALQPSAAPLASGPLRINGRVEDGLYWSIRAAGASPQVAAAYLAALATQIDVGDVSTGSSFDMVLSSGHDLLYAGLKRAGEGPLQLVRWTESGRPEWIDAANTARPEPVESGLMMPVSGGHITSYFGNRYHPILHYVRFHAGLDIGASWGSPIVAAGDGRIVAAGWAGGYGREVQIAHAAGIVSLYGHMSEIVAAPGSYVRAGQLIGYVGSSGLSTGPHVHFEVRQNGTPVNPLSVHFASMPTRDPNLVNAVKARLQALLKVGDRRG
jgi:murein DD-endopeptidase MepM/ murein hydrolase activator NlpD